MRALILHWIMLVLASLSPRRAEILRQAGIPFVVRAAGVDESLLAGTANTSLTFTDLAGSACLVGLGWTFAVFVLLGVIVFSRSQLKHYRRRQRRKLSNADTQSTPPAAAH